MTNDEWEQRLWRYLWLVPLVAVTVQLLLWRTFSLHGTYLKHVKDGVKQQQQSEGEGGETRGTNGVRVLEIA